MIKSVPLKYTGLTLDELPPSGVWFHKKMSSYHYRKSHYRDHDHCIIIMGFPILVRWCLYIESTPRCQKPETSMKSRSMIWLSINMFLAAISSRYISWKIIYDIEHNMRKGAITLFRLWTHSLWVSYGASFLSSLKKSYHGISRVHGIDYAVYTSPCLSWSMIQQPVPEIVKMQTDGLVQDCSNSIANAMELLQSCTKASKYILMFPVRCLPSLVAMPTVSCLYI